MGIIARQSIKGTAVTYIGVAVGFLTTFFVLTRFLTAEEIGLARVLIDAATLFASLAQLGTSASIIRFYPYFQTAKSPSDSPFPLKGRAGEGSSSSDNGFWFWTLIVPLVGFALFTLLYVVCRAPLSGWFGEKSPLFVDYYYFIIPMAFCMLYQAVFETSSNVKMRIVVPRAVRELIVRIGLLACYLLYAFRVLSLDGFVVALCLNYGVAALINITYLIAYNHPSWKPDFTFLKTHRPLVRDYLFYTGFLFISAVASAVAPMLSSFFITAKMGLDYTGIFAIATYIAVMVSIPYRSLTAIASPQLAGAIKNNDREQMRTLMQQVSGNTLLVGIAILLAIWINIDLIFHLLPNGSTYAAARTTILILGVSQLIMATFSIHLTALNFSRYYIVTLLYSVVLTASSIALNNYLIPRYGINGAALSNMLSYILYYTLIVATQSGTMRVPPFSRKMFVMLILGASMLILNELWCQYLHLDNIWADSICRSVLLLGIFLYEAYKLQLSPQINALLHQIFIQRH